MTLKEWIASFNSGRFDSMDFSKAVKAGWTDWNCPEKRIKGKTLKCAKILSRITDAELLSRQVEIRNMDTFDRVSLPGEPSVVIDLLSDGYVLRTPYGAIRCSDASSCLRELVRHMTRCRAESNRE